MAHAISHRPSGQSNDTDDAQMLAAQDAVSNTDGQMAAIHVQNAMDAAIMHLAERSDASSTKPRPHPPRKGPVRLGLFLDQPHFARISQGEAA